MDPRERDLASLQPFEVRQEGSPARSRFWAFWQQAKNLGALGVLSERRRMLIEARYTEPFPTLNKLKESAGVTTRERVRQLIGSGIGNVWHRMPPHIQILYPLEELSSLTTPETRAKMSKAHKGRQSPMKGKKHTPETRARISKTLKTNWEDPDYQARMSEAFTGRKNTPEARARMSEAQRVRRQREKEKVQGVIFDSHALKSS